MESLDTRERLIGEFRRASALDMLHASHAVFFFRESDVSGGPWHFFFAIEIRSFFLSLKATGDIDGTNWDSPADPWQSCGAESSGALGGAAIGPRCTITFVCSPDCLGGEMTDKVYDDGDRARAVFFARLLRHFMAKSEQLAAPSAFGTGEPGREVPTSTLVLGLMNRSPACAGDCPGVDWQCAAARRLRGRFHRGPTFSSERRDHRKTGESGRIGRRRAVSA